MDRGGEGEEGKQHPLFLEQGHAFIIMTHSAGSACRFVPACTCRRKSLAWLHTKEGKGSDLIVIRIRGTFEPQFTTINHADAFIADCLPKKLFDCASKQVKKRESRVFSLRFISLRTSFFKDPKHFLVIAHDYQDAQTLERRLAVRDKHLVLATESNAKGHLLLGGAILDSHEVCRMSLPPKPPRP